MSAVINSNTVAPPPPPVTQAEQRATKTCAHCGQRKGVDQYYKNARAKDGLQAWCNECMRVAGADLRKRRKACRGEMLLAGRTAAREAKKNESVPGFQFTTISVIDPRLDQAPAIKPSFWARIWGWFA